MKQKWILWIGFGIVFLLRFLLILKEAGKGSGDFIKAYYPAGTQVLTNPFSLYFGKGEDTCYGFVNIPILAYIFTPLTLFTQDTAARIFAVIGFIAIILTWWLLIKTTKISGWKIVALTGLFLVNEPLYYSLRLGNTTHFVLLLLVVANYFFQVKKEIWRGVLLAIAAIIKIPFWILGIYYFASKKWRVIIGYFGAILAIVGASIGLFGIDLHLFWQKQCIAPFADKPIGAFNMQSVNGFLARLLLNPQLSSYKLLDIDWKFRLTRNLIIFILIASVVLTFWILKLSSKAEEVNLEFSIILCLAILISPISWSHYYLVLLLIFSLYLGNQLAIPKGYGWAILIWLSAILTSLPLLPSTSPDSNTIYGLLLSKLLVSHYFLGGILLFGTLLAAKWKIGKYSQQITSDT